MHQEAISQFDTNIRNQTLGTGADHRLNPGYDPDCEPHAGIPSFVNVTFDRLSGMRYATTISSRNANTLTAIEDALKHLDPAA